MITFKSNYSYSKKIFSAPNTPTPTLQPTQPLNQRVLRLHQGYSSYSSPPSSNTVKMQWTSTSTPLCLHSTYGAAYLLHTLTHTHYVQTFYDTAIHKMYLNRFKEPLLCTFIWWGIYGLSRLWVTWLWTSWWVRHVNFLCCVLSQLTFHLNTEKRISNFTHKSDIYTSSSL